MKKLLLTLTLAFSATAHAQIPNSGFENLNPDTTIKNWGAVILLPCTFDLNSGVASCDSLVVDYRLYFSTADAHSGSKAVELRNAYDYTANYGIAGRISVSQSDTAYGMFTTPINMLQPPAAFTFYYKFLPVAGDTAFAHLTLIDSNGYQVGEAIKYISAAASTYSFASAPIVYTSNTPPAFASIDFCTAKAGSTPHFGTHFLIDDVGMGNAPATGIQSTVPGNRQLRCFPNPAEDQLSVVLNEPLHDACTISISDATGKLIETHTVAASEKNIRLPVSHLQKGYYLLTLSGGGQVYRTAFIK